MIGILALIIFAAYLFAGYFVLKLFPEVEATGEVLERAGVRLGAMYLLWPLFLIGFLFKRLLQKMGLYHRYLGTIFTVLIAMLIVIIFAVYAKEIFRK